MLAHEFLFSSWCVVEKRKLRMIVKFWLHHPKIWKSEKFIVFVKMRFSYLYHWNQICFIFLEWFEFLPRFFFASNYHDVLTYFPCQILRWKTLQTVTLIFQDLSANWTWMWCAHDYLNEHLQNKINCVWRRLKFTENFRRYTFRFEEDAKYISFSACLFK